MKKTHKELSGFNLKKKKSPFLSWPGIISMVRCGIIIILSLYSVVESSRKTDQIRHEMWGGAEAFKRSLVITKSENGTTLFFFCLCKSPLKVPVVIHSHQLWASYYLYGLRKLVSDSPSLSSDAHQVIFFLFIWMLQLPRLRPAQRSNNQG